MNTGGEDRSPAARAGRLIRRAVAAIVLLAGLALILASPLAASAAVPVHVTPTDTVAPDSCAICHRAHTANTELAYVVPGSADPTGNALVISPDPARGDVSLCYNCHGIAALGASVDVESSFEATSAHKIAPATSLYGRSPKMCGSCHDPHGSARTPSGTPYPGLLRSWANTITPVYAAEEYCVACHKNRPASNRFQTLAVYKQTAHYLGIPDPPSGSKIRCLICHAPHGSDVKPLIVGMVYPPAAPATLPVPVNATHTNDRATCLACHPNARATWGGGVAYAVSSHADTVAVVAALGEWPPGGLFRRVGECQVCHAPMGKAGAGGIAIPKLGERAGRALCDGCHDGAVAGTRIKQLAYPIAEGDAPELVAVYGPSLATTDHARISVYGRATSGADPRPLIGPRQYGIVDATSTAAAGDVDGDGDAELFVANPSASKLKRYEREALLGLTTTLAPWDISVGIRPDFILIGRFVGADTGPTDQVAVVDAAARELRVYRWNGTALDPLWPAAGAYSLGAGSLPTGLASGDVTGTELADLVVTDAGTTDQLHILTQDGSGAVEMTETLAPTQPGPRGPSVGNAWSRSGKDEIVVCNAEAATATVSVFDGAGEKLGDYTADDGGSGGDVPYASVVANVVPGVGGGSGAEVSIALFSEAGTSTINVFKQDVTPGLDPTPLAYDNGLMFQTGSIAAGNVDGDVAGTIELVVGNGGRWAKAAGMVAPSVQVFRWDGSAMAVSATLPGGGVELAGSAPALVLADFGPVLPSRHPIDEYNATAHVSTETADFPRHVTCSDCHDSHQANHNSPTAPWNLAGRLFGAWGIPVTNNAPGVQPTFGSARASTYQYELCFKCHSASIALYSRPDLAALVSTRNVSVHAVEEPSADATARPSTFVSGNDENGRVLYCTECHDNAAGVAEAKGLHRSTAAPLLAAKLLGTEPGDASALCYRCHKWSVYYSGTADGAAAGSRFFQTTLGNIAGVTANGALHALHVRSWSDPNKGLGFACSACHVTHGSSTLPHLLRDDVGYTHTAPPAHGGSCTNACHTAAHSYDGS
ncbi:MAG TPA: hypothetical protein VF902_05415 [Coriobacteriia bacterium]